MGGDWGREATRREKGRAGGGKAGTVYDFAMVWVLYSLGTCQGV